MAASDRRLAIERLKVRAEMRSAGDDEDTGVIEQEALSRAPRPTSGPPPHAKSLVAVLNTLPGWGRVVVLLALIAAVAASGTKLTGVW